MTPGDSPGVRRMVVERLPAAKEEEDLVAVEEPLEIVLDERPHAITMRTPGADRELVAGFLFTEGLIDGVHELAALELEEDRQGGVGGHRARVRLAGEAAERAAARPPRELAITSACGVCGKPSLEDLWRRIPRIESLEVDHSLLAELPERMRQEQTLFAASGGIHAAGLFDTAGELELLFEDVGRHNAVDKVIGAALLAGRLPLSGRILVVSGRAGFEIVQKGLVAGLPVLAAVGAASSLAVEVASLGGLTLYSFLSRERVNRHLPIEPQLRGVVPERSRRDEHRRGR